MPRNIKPTHVFAMIIILYIVYIIQKHKNVSNIVMALNDSMGKFTRKLQKHGFSLSIISKKDNEILADFIHEYPGKKSGTWFYASGTPIDLYGNNRQAIFVTGGKGQNDGLLLYNKKTKIMENIIDKTNLSSKLATYGAVSVDLDKDGYTDLIVTREDGVTLYKNIKNTGKFKIIKIMDKQPNYTPIGLAISDYDKDGNADIFVSQFIDMNLAVPNQFDNPSKHAPNVMLRGIGNNKFKNVSEELGLTGRWNTFTSIFIDLNNDTHPDLVQSPDAAKMYVHKNIDGTHFIEMDNPAGSGFWMGIASGDIDNDGDQDLFLTNVGSDFSPKSKALRGSIKSSSKLNVNHVLLRNDGNFKFVDITRESNVLEQSFGWGAIFEDIDYDSNLDLLFAQNSYFLPQHHIKKAPGAVMINQENNKFKQINKFKNDNFGQTPIFVDVDNDGIKDIIWINLNGPTKTYLNKTKNNYINILLPDNSTFANSIIIVKSNNKIQTKEFIIGGQGMSGDQSNMISFGLGDNNMVDYVNVKTTKGIEYKFNKPKINSTLIVKEK